MVDFEEFPYIAYSMAKGMNDQFLDEVAAIDSLFRNLGILLTFPSPITYFNFNRRRLKPEDFVNMVDFEQFPYIAYSMAKRMNDQFLDEVAAIDSLF